VVVVRVLFQVVLAVLVAVEMVEPIKAQLELLTQAVVVVE
jgi:hypothetical protein